MSKNVCYVMLSSLVLILCFQNCADQDFDFEVETGPSISGQLVSHNQAEKFKIERFQVDADKTKVKKAVDVIWLVDNSSSMIKEAAQVRSNIRNFVEYLSKSAKTNLTLVSLDEDEEGVQLPTDLPNIMQVKERVTSTNSLNLLIDLINDESDYSKDFKKLWRPGVPKAIVFVTDGDSRTTVSEFFAEMPEHAIADIKSFNSIIGLKSDKLNTCAAQHGSVYEELSLKYEGQVFNICEEDWSSTFEDLVVLLEDKFGDPLLNRFEVTSSLIKEIKSVKINGVSVDTKALDVFVNTITIDSSAFISGKEIYEIEIEYYYE